MEEFLGRPFPYMDGFVRGMKLRDADGDVPGLVIPEGNKWKEQRRFALNTLGMAMKGSMEDIIMEEVEGLCDRVNTISRADKDSKISVRSFFAPATNNVIWRNISGRQTNQNDPEIAKLTRDSYRVFVLFEVTNWLGFMQIYNGWIGRICQFFGLEDNIFDVSKDLNKTLYQEAEEGTPDKDGSFVDRHHHMMQIHKDNPGSVFNKENGLAQLKGSLWDMFLAGTDTSSTFLEWSVRFLCAYPDIQAKVYAEIEEKIGTRSATLDDRGHLHLLEAFTEEVMRHSHMLDLGPAHRVTEDVTFRGYFFPKGTQVYANIGGIHFDEKYWKDPNTFKPERFLTSKGEFRSDERIGFFGIGKRRCMGEILARAEIFLFLAALIQHFKFLPLPGENTDIVRDYGIITYPKAFDVRVECRF